MVPSVDETCAGEAGKSSVGVTATAGVDSCCCKGFCSLDSRMWGRVRSSFVNTRVEWGWLSRRSRLRRATSPRLCEKPCSTLARRTTTSSPPISPSQDFLARLNSPIGFSIHEHALINSPHLYHVRQRMARKIFGVHPPPVPKLATGVPSILDTSASLPGHCLDCPSFSPRFLPLWVAGGNLF